MPDSSDRSTQDKALALPPVPPPPIPPSPTPPVAIPTPPPVAIAAQPPVARVFVPAKQPTGAPARSVKAVPAARARPPQRPLSVSESPNRKRARPTPKTTAEVETQRRRMPAWLTSLVAHVLFLIVLAIIPLNELANNSLTLFLGKGSDGIAAFELSESQSVQLDAQESDPLSVAEPTLDTSELLTTDLSQLFSAQQPSEFGEVQTSVTIDIPFGLAKGLTGRNAKNKKLLLSKFGGSQATEDAVELGLAWLAEQQKSDGSWSLVGPYPSGGVNENKTAATALALNAFLGAGYTQRDESKYNSNIRLGLKYLLKRQDKDGFFADKEPSRQQMYAQAIASITVIEAYGMTGDSELHVAADRAIEFAEWSQSKLKGWRYDPREDADLSVTGWFLMALETGKMAGLAVDDEILEGISVFLDSVSHDEKSRYAYTQVEPPSLSMTAEGLLCRIMLGWPRSHPALLRGIEDDLLQAIPMEGDPEYSVYFWYYATQVLHHVGGRAWDEWNEGMKRTLPRMQTKTGAEMGSWDPGQDMFGAAGGRLYTTCLSIYCLEVYYRHLSIYAIK